MTAATQRGADPTAERLDSRLQRIYVRQASGAGVSTEESEQ
jgi:hypothetical protein